MFQLLPTAFTVKTKLADVIHTGTSVTCPRLLSLACFLPSHTAPYIPSSSFQAVPAPSLTSATTALISSLFCPSSLLYLPQLKFNLQNYAE